MNNDKSGTMFGRGDVESAAGRELTDEEWEQIKATYEWRKGLPDRLTERGWEIIHEALAAVGIKKDTT
jgi:hypothetical protein